MIAMCFTTLSIKTSVFTTAGGFLFLSSPAEFLKTSPTPIFLEKAFSHSANLISQYVVFPRCTFHLFKATPRMDPFISEYSQLNQHTEALLNYLSNISVQVIPCRRHFKLDCGRHALILMVVCLCSDFKLHCDTYYIS